MIEPAFGEYLDRWATIGEVEGRAFVRLPFLRGVWEFIVRRRRFTATGVVVPWMHREESDAELRAKILAKWSD